MPFNQALSSLDFGIWFLVLLAVVGGGVNVGQLTYAAEL